jgi:DNA-binding NarL/FixJ family response regulator
MSQNGHARGHAIPQASPRNVCVALGQFGALVGRGLIDVLRDDDRLRLVAKDLDQPALESVLSEQKPEIAIIDEASATEPSLLGGLLAVQPGLGLIVLAHLPSRGYAAKMLAAGATCLSKDAPAEDILATVHLAAEGHYMLKLSTELHGRLRSRGEAARLTPRQAEVLRYIRLGQSYPTIAHTLGINVETVRTHAGQVRRKLGARKSDLVGLQV